MQYLNEVQQQILKELTEEIAQGRTLTIAERLALPDMAAMIYELRQLQIYINKEGTTYTVVGKSGDLYNKHRPEYQQLTELRKELRQLRKQLLANAVEEASDVSEYFN
jgi:hypothetical protein